MIKIIFTLIATAFFIITDSCSGPSIQQTTEQVCMNSFSCYATDGNTIWQIK